jgi:hypothetical protein
VILQVLVPEADRHAPVESPLDDHPATTFPRIDRFVQLVVAVLGAYRVIVGHRPRLVQAQDSRQVESTPQRPVRVGGLGRLYHLFVTDDSRTVAGMITAGDMLRPLGPS